MMDFLLNILHQPLMILALIIFLGYAIGRINFFGVSFGGAGILLVALVFGHFGLDVGSTFKNLGLVCFVTSIGLVAGPEFFSNFKKHFKSYILLGVAIVGVGALTCASVIKFANIPADLAVGIYTGALTSTPGLAAAMEASGSQTAAVGYGIAYPFGVVSVVLFVQLLPKFLHIDLKKEKCASEEVVVKKELDTRKLIDIDKHGFAIFALTVILGIVIAKIKVPLPGGTMFSLGMSGGPLFAGLIIGHLGRLGSFNLKVPDKSLSLLKEAGMVLFLAGAGTNAGEGFIEILKEQGMILFFCGAIMTIVPMFVGYIIARKMLKLNLKNSLGSICGGMTSTPALGALVDKAESNDVVTAYVATYPVALVSVVISSQWIIKLMA